MSTGSSETELERVDLYPQDGRTDAFILVNETTDESYLVQGLPAGEASYDGNLVKEKDPFVIDSDIHPGKFGDEILCYRPLDADTVDGQWKVVDYKASPYHIVAEEADSEEAREVFGEILGDQKARKKLSRESTDKNGQRNIKV